MKRYIKFFFFLLIPSLLVAQKNPYWENPPKEEINRMRTEFKDELNDSIRMYMSRRLGTYYFEINTDSSLYFLENELSIAKKLNLKLWEADAWCQIGYVSSLMSNYSKALSSLLTALKISEDEASEKNIWRISYFTKENNPQTARLIVVASTIHNLGHLYGWTRNTEKQLAKYLEALNIIEKTKDLPLLTLVHMNIGDVYQKMNQLDTALAYEQKALKYSDYSGFKKYKGLIFIIMGDISVKQGKYDIAKKYFLESIKTNEEQSVYSFLAEGCVSLANLFLMMGNFDSSFYYASKGLEVAKSTGYLYDVVDACKILSSIYESRSNIDSAFKYQKLAFAINDSLFTIEKNNQFQNINLEEQQRLQEQEKTNIKIQNQTRTYAFMTGLAVFLLIGLLLYRNSRQKQKANKILESTLTNLKATQSQLIQSEKMASLGELTAGIAHEIQNPLNFVNNFSEVNVELIDELKTEVRSLAEDEISLRPKRIEMTEQLIDDIKANSEKINHHGKRAGDIVKGMLQHSRSSSGVKEPTDINALCDEYLRLGYHGLRAKDKDFNATMKTDFDDSIGKINIIPQDIGRVVLSLLNNAFYAVDQRLRQAQPDTGYEPTVSITTKKVDGNVEIKVTDNGNGIPQKVLDKIFQPFFTTKPTGQGTGLGLSLSYDIVRAHGGELKVETKEVEGSSFIIHLPFV